MTPIAPGITTLRNSVVAQLVAAVPALGDETLRCRQVAQVDSKDMNWSIWRALAQALSEELASRRCGGCTHGTDTPKKRRHLPHRLHVMDASRWC